jgi:hypothetical protein
MSVDQQFDELAQEMIRKAGQIKCSSGEYAEGLTQMAEELMIAADAARCDEERNSDDDEDLGQG